MVISNKDIERQKPDLNKFIERNNNILDEFLDIYKEDREPAYKEVHGTSIPYVFNLLGSWLINPSTVSISTFQRMSYSDSVITSSLEYNTSIISNTIGDYYHENKKIQKFIRTCFDHLSEGKTGLIRDMLTAMWAGFYVGEKVYSKPSEFIDGKVWIKSVIAFPPTTVLFRVNRAGQLDEFLYQYVYFAQNPGIQNSLSYLTPGWGLPGYGAGGGGTEFGAGFGPNWNIVDGLAFTGDVDFPLRTTNIQTVGMIPVPRTKCIHYVRKGEDGFLNPYGRSMLRSAYNFYVLKCAFLQFLAIAGDRKSTPLLLLYVDPNAMTTNSQVSPNMPDPVQNNPQAAQTAINTATEALARLRGDSALILPGMKGAAFEVDVADIGANLNLFIDCLRYCDDSMRQSLLNPGSLIGSGQEAGGSYASTASQESVNNRLLSTMRNSITTTIISDFVKDLIQKNYQEEEYNNDFGYFESQLINIEDKTNLIKQYEAMVNSGLTSPDIKEDINKYRQKLGDRELTDKELNEIKKYKEELDMPKTKDTTNKTDVKSTDSHYKKNTNKPKGGSSS
jgi:hypothetical protein